MADEVKDETSWGKWLFDQGIYNTEKSWDSYENLFNIAAGATSFLGVGLIAKGGQLALKAGLKQGGKLLGKEAAEEGVEQAAKRGVGDVLWANKGTVVKGAVTANAGNYVYDKLSPVFNANVSEFLDKNLGIGKENAEALVAVGKGVLPWLAGGIAGLTIFNMLPSLLQWGLMATVVALGAGYLFGNSNEAKAAAAPDKDDDDGQGIRADGVNPRKDLKAAAAAPKPPGDAAKPDNAAPETPAPAEEQPNTVWGFNF